MRFTKLELVVFVWFMIFRVDVCVVRELRSLLETTTLKLMALKVLGSGEFRYNSRVRRRRRITRGGGPQAHCHLILSRNFDEAESQKQ